MKPEETDEEPEESASKTSTVVESSSQMSQANSQASGTAAVTADEKPKKKEKLIKNQFNYQDRGTQSGNTIWQLFGIPVKSAKPHLYNQLNMICN